MGLGAVRSITYLQGSAVEIEGLKIYGSPWQPEFQGWAFNLPRGPRLREKWRLIPEGLDILVTHGPLAHRADGAEGPSRGPRREASLFREAPGRLPQMRGYVRPRSRVQSS